ncbi:hypothetical protein ILYODFUR_013888 [Ilyodon furcidens]|uniref:Secreted protein n=1 Tax=Ilyodon furcidens TaxID=33524 RepID=A0ABV0UUJ8_9TELE
MLTLCLLLLLFSSAVTHTQQHSSAVCCGMLLQRSSLPLPLSLTCTLFPISIFVLSFFPPRSPSSTNPKTEGVHNSAQTGLSSFIATFLPYISSPHAVKWLRSSCHPSHQQRLQGDELTVGK